MPELALCGSPTPSTPLLALLDSIDAALNSYAAPTLHSLKIEVSGVVDQWDVPADRIAPWLRFASKRLAGKLRLRVYLRKVPEGTATSRRSSCCHLRESYGDVSSSEDAVGSTPIRPSKA
jgi:hypothetical protein